MSVKYIAILLFFSAGVTAFGKTFGDFEYETYGSGASQSVTITKYRGKAAQLTIPDTINGAPVTFITEGAFADSESLTSIAIDEQHTAYSGINGVLFTKDQKTLLAYPGGKQGDYTIPASVTRIGARAFSGCAGLTGITIPNSVIAVGDGAFWGCESLTAVAVPSSVLAIGDWAFWNCGKLKSLTLSSQTKHYGFPQTISYGYYKSGVSAGFEFDINGNTVIITKYTGTNNSPVIPSRLQGLPVTAVRGYAFSGCIGLVGVTIPSSVTVIGDGAFSGCVGLVGVTIPASVTAVRDYTFSGCLSLESVVIPSSVTAIGDRAFFGCRNLESVVIPSSVTAIGGYAFSECVGLTSIAVPASVTAIGDRAFSGCSNITDISLLSPITVIGQGMFYRCRSLTGITIPPSVTAIGAGAFSYCDNLTSITIPASVMAVGNGAFANCPKLRTVVHSKNTRIGANAFPSNASVSAQ